MKFDWVRLSVWTSVALLLVVLMLRQFDSSMVAALDRLAATPFWMWASVLVLNSIMTAIGAVKWRIMRNWVSPDSTPVDSLTLGAVTAMGSFASLFIPAQLAHVLVRWWIFRRRQVSRPGVLGSTFFEQVFDLAVYLSAAALAIVVLLLDLDGLRLAGAMLLGMVLILVGSRVPLVLFIRIAVLLGHARLPDKVRQFMRSAETRFRLSETGPVRRLMSLALILLVLRVMTVLAIASAISPGVDLVMVAAGVPAVALLSVLPITPAGLGIAEWSWAALLAAAGASLPDAAVAALGFRFVNAAALLAVSTLLGALWQARN